MLLKIGGAKRPDTVEGALLDCHDRIRFFSALACKLNAEGAGSPEEIGRSAGAVRRYFAEALPKHVEDEEESLLPRLRGREEAVDAALDQMRAEHERDGPAIEELISICAALEADPSRWEALSPRLEPVASAVDQGLREHLELEEERILPAIERLLSEHEREAVRAEMKQRRDWPSSRTRPGRPSSARSG